MLQIMQSKIKLFYFILISTGFLMWTFSTISFFYINLDLFYIGIVTSVLHLLTGIRVNEENLIVRVHILVLVGFIFQVCYSFYTGGFYSVVLNWIALLPLIIGLVARKQDVLIWILLTTLTPFVFFMIQDSSVNDYHLYGKLMTHFFTTLGLIFLNGVFTFFMLSLFDKIRKKEQYENEIDAILKSYDSLSTISHDLNNGLMRVVSEVLLLERKGVDVKRMKECVQLTIRDIKLLSEKISIFSYSETFDYFNLLIKDITDKNKEVKITQEFIINNKVNVALLKNVFQVLINNSLEANASKIDIKISLVHRNVVIEQSDNGDAIIEPEKIFEPFFSSKDILKNKGTGLSSLKILLRNVHGSIVLCESDNKMFRVEIPYDKIKQTSSKEG